ncbi:MAG: tRNA guanosine(34) transglycosylase Tgt [Bacteroidales bacterium]|nr:tRNA guanosine(34) transglycosylase Tgt [Bacteroidales bacterium]NLK82040.1 tRNA guanosine(34) transglycosylase Tgt [Bacteroidales bacterium]
MKFEIHNSDTNSHARAGTITTDHGNIQTPVFMPVGTLGSVKGVHFKDLEHDIRAQIILGNTYHLYLRPGLSTIEKAGGLHSFIGWNKPILTDSGGFQVFSLSDTRKITEEGAIFKSHIDGSKHIFTPENVVDTQRIIGADIIMAFDECTPYPCDYEYAKKSMLLTHRWLERGIHHFKNTQNLYNHSQAFFPIVQGSMHKDLRLCSAEFVASQDMKGNAIGGLSVGEPEEKMYEMLAVVTNVLPVQKPRYLMGVGTPVNILNAIELGVDMFDCVMPTRNGRNGMLFTWDGIINIKNKKWEQDYSPLDPKGTSFVDSAYTKAYVRHLIHSGEMLGAQIASIHNLAFYISLVTEARKHICNGTFYEWKKSIITNLSQRL